MIAGALRLFSRYSHVNWALADQAMVSGVNFATNILLARFLGLEEFGRFTLAWMVVLFVNSIQQAVIIQPMMSVGPMQTKEDEADYYGAVALQQVIFGGAVFALVWVGTAVAAMAFPEWHLGGLALPLACAALAFQLQECMRRYFFTLGRGGMAFAVDALRYLGQLAVLFWLFRTVSMDTEGTLWVITGLAGAAVLAAIPVLGPITWRREVFRATAERHWRSSKWLIGSALMQWTTGNLFILVSGAMLGAWAVGALKAAQNLIGVSHILIRGLENVMPVRASMHFHKGGKKALIGYLWRVGLLSELVIGAIAVTAAVAPELWLSLVFGDEYREYGYLLQWYAVRYALFFVTLPLQAGLRAIERTDTIFWASVARTIFSTLAVYPLISLLGLLGVMIGLVCTALIALAVLIYYFSTLVYLSRQE